MSLCSEPGFSSEEVLNLRYPLHRACRDGDLGCLRTLLQGPPGNTALQLGKEDSCYGWTPIHWAAHFGKLECLIQLVRAGCSVNASTTRFSQTPAHIAAFGGHPQCLTWLIQAGAVINKQDYVGETPVHKAARAGSMDCLKALVSHGAQIDFRNASGLTAADLAHSQGFRECAQFLLNLQNNQLNGFYYSSSLNGVNESTPPNHLNGGTNRKRSFQDAGSTRIKKLRTDENCFGTVQTEYTTRGLEDDVESMHVEMHSELSDANGSINVLTNGSTANGHVTQHNQMDTSPSKICTSPKELCNGIVTNGNMEKCESHGNLSDNKDEVVNVMSGSLHVNGSPSNWVTHKPSWSDSFADSLQYGHYHGFGDTAESLPELSSVVEHSNSVSVEYKYNTTFISTLHQYQGF
ncbi:ankyrin repeat domain-containing protein 10 [Bombina bombina]|uniref:ankyrin repeat domain-containing protein 10 n=1 Tax=Bombina bombina TaxID=8345 RepID=UPI00235A9302|nr:ankyrin repeat domain-containing protein 10 [Bombina bombina]